MWGIQEALNRMTPDKWGMLALMTHKSGLIYNPLSDLFSSKRVLKSAAEAVPYSLRVQNFVDTLGYILKDRERLEDADKWELLQKQASELLSRYRAFNRIPVSEDNLEISEPFEGFEAGTLVSKIRLWFDMELDRIANRKLEPVPQE